MGDENTEIDVEAMIAAKTTDWTGDPGWMNAKNQTPRSRGKILNGIQRELAPFATRFTDQDQIDEANIRMSAACRIGDKEVPFRLGTHFPPLLSQTMRETYDLMSSPTVSCFFLHCY